VRCRSFVATALCAAQWLGALPAGAEEPARAPEPAETTRWVKFRAGRVDLDLADQKLELSQGVEVRVDRYRLTSDRLELRRGPRGVVVTGSGRVATCPCRSAPITVGFESVTVAPPTDLLIEDPTVRVGGCPVLWLPYFWLRAPDRVGMLPPEIAWRGEEGLYAGAGIHLPWRGDPPHAEVRSWDVRAGGYLRGGAAVDSRLTTPESTTRVRWDYLRTSLVAVDASGSFSRADRSATGAYRADAIRGERGRLGTMSLDAAARRYDRMEVGVGHAGAAWTTGVELRADAPRGGPMTELGAVGPRGHVGFGSALGSYGWMDAAFDATTVHEPARGTATVVTHRRSLALFAPAGPLGLEIGFIQDLSATSTEGADGGVAFTVGRARVALPLVRGFGSGPDPLRHWVEPFAEVAVGHTTRRGALLDPTWPADGSRLSALLGAGTAIGRDGSRGAGSLDLAGGVVGPVGHLLPALRARAVTRAALFGLGADAAWLPDHPQALGLLVHAALGRPDGFLLSAYTEGRLAMDPTTARWVTARTWLPPRSGFLDRPGFSAGSAVAAAWSRAIATTVSLDGDLGEQQLLGVRGGISYRHPCGCLGAAAWAGERLGRRGLDAWVGVDLLP
jgi:hypothetical protein